MEITCITVDCREPGALAEFWNAALEWGGVAVSDDGRGAVCGPVNGDAYLEFVRVPEHKTIKNRVHLGCSGGTLSQLGQEIDHLLDLGATIAWEEEFPDDVAASYRNLVLRDPEGNEFCLGGGSLLK